MKNTPGNIDESRFEEAIHMLTTYANEPSLKPFISILEALQQDPNNEALLTQLYNEFQGLGIDQGAVLTHAPSIYHFIVGDPFND